MRAVRTTLAVACITQLTNDKRCFAIAIKEMIDYEFISPVCWFAVISKRGNSHRAMHIHFCCNLRVERCTALPSLKPEPLRHKQTPKLLFAFQTTDQIKSCTCNAEAIFLQLFAPSSCASMAATSASDKSDDGLCPFKTTRSAMLAR